MHRTDFYLTDDGDLAVSNQGDVALTQTPQEQIKQQCNMRLATQRNDFVPYPEIGASLQRLVGLPNTKNTAVLGRKLIERALCFDGFVPKGRLKIDSYPTNIDTIVFEVAVPWGIREYVNIQLEQILTL